MTKCTQKPILQVILGDGDQWAVEAEWPDGTLERINTFNNHSSATGWISTQSEAWLEVRTSSVMNRPTKAGVLDPTAK